MFKTAQEHSKKQTHKQERIIDGSFISIRTARILLDNDKYIALIEKFPSLLSFNKEQIEQFVDPLIQRFAEYVQELPETRGGYYSLKGSILEHCLNRTVIALSLLRSYFLPNGSENQSLSAAQSVWAYAIFSAGLLQGIGKIAVDFRIDIYDRLQKHLKTWNPFEGSMIGKGTYFKYEFDTPYPDKFKSRATLILAKQIMPVSGFNWIAEHKDLFAIWLALLEEDAFSARTLGPILWRAEAMATHEFIGSPHEKDPSNYLDNTKSHPGLSNFLNQEGKELHRHAGAMGADFLMWMKEKIESGEFSLKEGALIATEEGILITDDAFKQFSKEKPQYKKWEAVQTQFINLNLTAMTQHNDVLRQFMNTVNRQTVSGLLIRNPYLILSENHLSKIQDSQYIAQKSIKPEVLTPYIDLNGKLTAQAPIPNTTPTIKLS